MRVHGRLFTFSAVAALCALCACGGQKTDSVFPAVDLHAAVHDTTVTVPIWKSSFTYDGVTYPFKIVGSDPHASPVTTEVVTYAAPLKLIFANGDAFDPGEATTWLAASPIFVNADFTSGTTQFGDAMVRAEFWKLVRNTQYHVLLDPPIAEPTVTLNVPASDGYTQTIGGVLHGYVTFSWFIGTIEPQIIAQDGIPPTALTIFMTSGVKLLQQTGSCCYTGYHGSFSASGSTWTTAWGTVGSASVDAMSHEVAEWLNDPFNANSVPPWVSPQSGGCGGHTMEVADPVTNFTYTIGGYEVTDVVFYSWFSRDVPSIGMQSHYDYKGHLTGPAAVCP